jgi:hypothetical protein
MMRNDTVIFETLKRHNVPFMIIGGHAVNFHGHNRNTEDADVVWLRVSAAEESLLQALTELEAQYIGKDIDPATGIERMYPVSLSFIKANHLMMLWTKFGFLDLFTYVPGHPKVDVEELFATAKELNGMKYPSLDWLRRMKIAAGRGKDLDDLEHLTPE